MGARGKAEGPFVFPDEVASRGYILYQVHVWGAEYTYLYDSSFPAWSPARVPFFGWMFKFGCNMSRILVWIQVPYVKMTVNKAAAQCSFGHSSGY